MMRKSYRRTLYVIALIALFLLVLPEMIRYGIQHGLEKMSAQVAEIDDVNLNLFTGKAALTGVNIRYADKPTLTLGRLSVDLDISALFSKHLLIEQLELVDVNVEIYEKEGEWVAVLPIPSRDQADGRKDLEQPPVENPWQFGIASVALKNIQVNALYQKKTHAIQLDQLTAGDLFMWEPDSDASLSLKGLLNGAVFDFSSDLKPFAEAQSYEFDLAVEQLDLDPLNHFLPEVVDSLAASLTLDTRIQLLFEQNGDFILNQDGVVALNLQEAKLAERGASADDIRWQGKWVLKLSKNGPSTLSANGKATVSQLAARDEQLRANASFENLTWSGRVDLQLPHSNPATIDLEGDLSLKMLAAEQASLNLSNRLESLSWVGKSALDLQDLSTTFHIDGDLKLLQWQLTDDLVKGDVAGFDSLSISDIQLSGLDKMTLSQVELKGFESLIENTSSGFKSEQGSKPVLSLDQVKLVDVNLQEQKTVHVTAVDLSGLALDITRNKDGQFAVVDRWLASLQTRVEEFSQAVTLQSERLADAVEEGANEARSKSSVADISANSKNRSELRYQLGGLRLSGKNQVTFNDHAITPKVVHPVVIEKMDIGSLASADSDLLTPMDIQLALYEFGQLKIAGKAQPLQPLEKMQADLTIDLKGVELTDLSPYLENLSGYHAESGQVNLDSTFKIKQGELNSETDLKVLRLQLEPVNQELIEKVGKKLAMPIDTALSVVTDSEDTLQLTIPVKGDLNNPDIHIDRIVGSAVTQAVQNAAVTYFKYAVQPFGAIMLVSETIGDMKLQAKFEPVRFIAGSNQIVSDQSGYLGKVAEMIKEKRDFSILICALVTDQDFQARKAPPKLVEGEAYEWDEVSQSLAKSRSDLIKERLIKEHGLAPDKVQTCRAQIGQGEPRAILGI